MANLDRIRVLVLHEDPVAQAGLTVAFANYPDFEIPTGPLQSADESDSAHSAHPLKVDVFVADYVHGLNLVHEIRHLAPGPEIPQVVVVAGIDREWKIRHALESGVRGYLLVGCSWEELTDGVRAVHRGDRYLSPEVAARLAESVSVEPLTPREQQVLRLVVDGLSNKGIARQLDIAVGTVKSHMKSIFTKLSVESRTQAVAVVERRGLLRSLHDVPPSSSDLGSFPTFCRPHTVVAVPDTIVA